MDPRNDWSVSNWLGFLPQLSLTGVDWELATLSCHASAMCVSNLLFLPLGNSILTVPVAIVEFLFVFQVFVGHFGIEQKHMISWHVTWGRELWSGYKRLGGGETLHEWSGYGRLGEGERYMSGVGMGGWGRGNVTWGLCFCFYLKMQCYK